MKINSNFLKNATLKNTSENPLKNITLKNTSKKCPKNVLWILSLKRVISKLSSNPYLQKKWKISPNPYFKQKWSSKNIQKIVSHTSKKFPLNVPQKKVLKPKTILCKNVLWMYLQEKSLNPKQFFAKSDQALPKIRPKQKYVKIINAFAEIYIALKLIFGGAPWYFLADGKLGNSSAKLL